MNTNGIMRWSGMLTRSAWKNRHTVPDLLPGHRYECKCGKVIGIEITHMTYTIRHELPWCDVYASCVPKGEPYLTLISESKIQEVLPTISRAAEFDYLVGAHIQNVSL